MQTINHSVMTGPETAVSSNPLRVEVELIKMLYQQALTALIGVIATATGIAVIFFNVIPNLIVASWLATIYGLTFIRLLSIKKFNALDHQTIDVIFWGRLFASFTFLSGLTWGTASIILFTPDNLQLFNILTLIIIAMSVGSLAALSAYPKSFYLFVIPAMLPMIWRYLSIDEQNYIIFGVLLFVFNFALLSIIRVNHRILRDAVNLRFENTDLINQLTLQKESAEQANAAKTKFLAAASHDLRQPLHAIGLFLGALEDRVEKNDQKLIVQKIQKSSNALNGLLDSLLDISKLDAGIIQANPEALCINNLLEALSIEYKHFADEEGIDIKFMKTKLWVNSDYQILERIMRNLISNAIRYTNKGGIVVGCRRYQGQVLVAVYDTGIGIHQDEFENIFSEFHQLHNPERDRSKGLGLGLAIVKRMAKLLEMPLMIKSVPGQGSTFGVIVPACPRSIVNTEQSSIKPETLFFDDKCVLVVDDEEEIRDSFTQLLKSWHCDVYTFASGSEVIEHLQANNIRPDLVLADYRLRDNETGIQVINEIKALYPDSVIPAIIITGDTAPECIKEAEISGYKTLHKPVAPGELRSLLDEILSTDTSDRLK